MIDYWFMKNFIVRKLHQSQSVKSNMQNIIRLFIKEMNMVNNFRGNSVENISLNRCLFKLIKLQGL